MVNRLLVAGLARRRYEMVVNSSFPLDARANSRRCAGNCASGQGYFTILGMSRQALEEEYTQALVAVGWVRR